MKNIRHIFFSKTVRVTNLKSDTHMDSELMYCVYWNPNQGPITLEINLVIGFTIAIK